MRIGSQPSDFVPGPGPFCSTAPRMKDIKNTKASAMVLSAVVKKPSGALTAGNIRFLRKGTQPTTRPSIEAIVGGGATLLNHLSIHSSAFTDLFSLKALRKHAQRCV